MSGKKYKVRLDVYVLSGLFNLLKNDSKITIRAKNRTAVQQLLF